MCSPELPLRLTGDNGDEQTLGEIVPEDLQPIRVEGACMEPMFHDRDHEGDLGGILSFEAQTIIQGFPV